ncbi:hypothetical protein N7491_006192, partial [Penicillium cf. griseofulvum]
MKDSKSRSLSPTLLEERDYPNSSSQVGTLTETQHELIDSIGNKQLASRLHKRTLKIFTREERLQAVEFYRAHVHINPQTGEERSLSIANASEALHISEYTLERWVNEETKITLMKYGNSRDDGERYASVSVSEQFKSRNYPFLRLTPEQLSAKKYVKGKYFYKLHPITHPVPFISIEGGRRGKIESFADAYKFLGHAEDTLHPGHPREPGSDLEIQSQKPIIEAAAPCLESLPGHGLRNENPTVQKVNSLLYHLAPNYGLRQLGLGRCTPCYEQLGACVSLVCEHLVAASDKVDSAIPVRIGFDYDEPFEGAPTHWAIKLLLGTRAEIMLPLSLCLRGSIKHEVVPNTLLLQGWTMDYEMLKCKTRKRQKNEERENAIRYSQEFYRKSQPIFEKFRLCPALYIEDVEMLFLGSQSWRPRRFSPTWTLYNAILHSSYRSGDTLTPIYGKYTNIESIVDSIVTKAPKVSFSVPAVQAFQLVSLEHFTLVPQVSEITVLSQFSKHLEVSDPCPGRGLRLESIEETLKQDAHTTCEREFRKKLQLKVLYGRPEKTWILDFEYISMPKRYSPIPLQLAIRQLDGKLLYQGNIDYGLSMKEFMDVTSSCYGGLSTNGETSLQVRDQIIKVCSCNPDDVKILSWFATQDMQCFLRILTGCNELVQDKISHKGHKNFQTINIGILCEKLFPDLLSTTLQSVHEFLSGGEGSRGKYHTASYDTEAMATIVKSS